MLIERDDGSQFELGISGYQFPINTWNWYDANWLVVNIRVKSPHGSWQASGPCLLTEEVDELARWFQDLSVGKETANESEFMEPVLAFRAVRSSPERVVIRIFFWLEFLPPWRATERVGEEDVWVELDVRREALGKAATALRDDLTRFPWRYPDRPDLRPRVRTPQGRALSDHAAEHTEPDRKV